MNILHFVDGLSRTISKGRPTIKNIEEVRDGLDTLQKCKVMKKKENMLDVTNFVCSLRISSKHGTNVYIEKYQPKKASHPLGKIVF